MTKSKRIKLEFPPKIIVSPIKIILTYSKILSSALYNDFTFLKFYFE